MAHRLPHLLASLRSELVLMSATDYQPYLEYLLGRNNELDLNIATSERLDKQEPIIEDGIGIIDISGAISHLSTPLQAICGMTSYQTIIQDFDDVLSYDEVNTVVMSINSGGGAARGCFTIANKAKEMCEEAGVKLVAYTEGRACSAAYAWMAIADEVVVSSDASVGSIGVITQLINYTGALEEEGIKVHTFKSGDKKDMGSPYREMTEEEAEQIQKSVDKTANTFFEHVSKYRDMSIESIKALQANVYDGDEAKELGLVDEVMTPFEFNDYLANISDEGKERKSSMIWKNKRKDKKLENEGEDTTMSDTPTVEELQAQLETAQAEKEAAESKATEAEGKLSQYEEELTSQKEAAKEAKLASIKTNLESYSAFGLDATEASKLALDAPEGLVKMFTDALDKAQLAVDESDSMKELGATGEGDIEKVSGTMKVLKEQNQ